MKKSFLKNIQFLVYGRKFVLQARQSRHCEAKTIWTIFNSKKTVRILTQREGIKILTYKPFAQVKTDTTS